MEDNGTGTKRPSLRINQDYYPFIGIYMTEQKLVGPASATAATVQCLKIQYLYFHCLFPFGMSRICAAQASCDAAALKLKRP